MANAILNFHFDYRHPSLSFITERWNKKFEYNKALVILDLVIPKNQGVPQNIL